MAKTKAKAKAVKAKAKPATKKGAAKTGPVTVTKRKAGKKK